jgi:hypothetical protein
MFARLNLVDRILMPAILLASLSILVFSCHVSNVSDDHPNLAQWVLMAVGLAYLLYQAIRIGSPLLTLATGAMIPVGCFGSVVVKNSVWNDIWRNEFWDSLNGFGAFVITVLLLAIICLPIVAATLIAWNVQRQRMSALAQFAMQMLRESNKIDAGALAQRCGISETEARACLSESIRSGAIPFKAEIV